MGDCWVSGIDHDPEIHAATVHVRRWLRDHVLPPVAKPQPK